MAKPRSGLLAMLGGAITALSFAFVTTLLLLVNGSAILVVFGILADSDPEWNDRKGLAQFGLFAAPLLMAVIQWMLWDFIRGLLAGESLEKD